MRIELSRPHPQRAAVGSVEKCAPGRARLAALAALAFALPASGAIVLESSEPAADRIHVATPDARDPARALAEAIAAWRAGDPERAIAGLLGLSAQAPIIADYGDLLRLRIAAEADDYANVIALGGSWAHADSPLLAEVQERLGDAYAATGDASAARAAWERALDADTTGVADARLHLKLAQSFAADGLLDAARTAYLVVWTSHPTDPEAAVANLALDALAAQRAVDPRTATRFRQRGDAFFRRRDNDAALADYDRALAYGALGKNEARRTKLKRAQTLFRLRRYPEAIDAYTALPKAPEYLIERARAVARAGDPVAAARELEVIARNSQGAVSARATFLAGLLWDGEGRTERASRLFERVVRTARGSRYANVALWNSGWTAFRDGRFAAAERAFAQLHERNATGLASLRARYWLARAREEQGARDADAAYTAIAREFPLTYYGWRARLRVDDRALPAQTPERAIPTGVATLGAAALERPRILLEAGLEAEARRELDRLYPRVESLADRLALSDFYADTGDFNRSQRLIVTKFNEPLARGPIPDQLEMWWYAWPAPFGEDMRLATKDGHRVEPGLVYAVMREESGYRPGVVSAVGARGLLQIMPKTGERLAQEVALAPFDPDDLFRPEVNIRLGSHYLGRLLAEFDGQTSAAIASYNAGPTAVSRWIDRGVEDDEWVEAIPYDETRAYVKRVLRSLYAYRVLY